MKFIFSALFTLCVCLATHQAQAQALYAPVTTTNYNYDAVAETSPSSLTTSGAIDGSNYIMHSMAYAALYSMSVGLPNSGLISTLTRTYQLQPYNQNNMLYLTTGQTDSIIFVNPAPFNALSLLGFSTEGAGSMNVTVRFTDNSTQVFSNIAVADWFNGAGNIFNSFGRTNRTTGAISNPSSAPNLYPYDLNLICANRVKNVKNIKVNNQGTNPRICIMAVSGASNSSSVTVASNPVTCAGGTNGSASVSATGGTPPFTYTWMTTPAQTGALANNLPVGTYSVVVSDAGGCSVTSTVAVSQSLIAQPPLFMSSNGTLVCLGNTVALAASGASSYTWITGSNLQLITVTPSANTIYTVSGLTSANCLLTGSIVINVTAPPTVTIGALPSSLCLNSATLAYTYGPSGGTLTAPGSTPGIFDPSVAGVGVSVISYTYTDSNNCSASATSSVLVNPTPTVSIALATNSFCTNSPGFTLTGSGTPSGGSYSGSGVSGSVFSPSAAGVGTSLVIYSYTDSNGCSNTDTTAAHVFSLAAPSLSVAKNTFCHNSANIQLSASPGGGQYSGTGISSTGVFSPTLAGVGTFSLSYSITSGVCTAAKTISVTVNSCIGVAEIEPVLFNLYPNPNKGSFYVKAETAMELAIYNELGQVVHTATFDSGDTTTLAFDNFAAGIYIVIARNGGQSATRKIIVAN